MEKKLTRNQDQEQEQVHRVLLIMSRLREISAALLEKDCDELRNEGRNLINERNGIEKTCRVLCYI